jgi:hypothetical protein
MDLLDQSLNLISVRFIFETHHFRNPSTVQTGTRHKFHFHDSTSIIFFENIDEYKPRCFFISMNFTESATHQNIFLRIMGKLRISILSSILLFSLSQLSAKDDTAAKLEAIEKRLASLEQENALLTKRILQLENSGTQAIAKQLPALIPKDETEKKVFFDTFRREFKSSQDQARGPWTNPEPWTKIRKRMSEYSVREILGRPSRMRPSVKPSVEVVYSYTGDLDSDGEDETGYVELKDKRVVSFKSPHTSE